MKQQKGVILFIVLFLVSTILPLRATFEDTVLINSQLENSQSVRFAGNNSLRFIDGELYLAYLLADLEEDDQPFRVYNARTDLSGQNVLLNLLDGYSSYSSLRREFPGPVFELLPDNNLFYAYPRKISDNIFVSSLDLYTLTLDPPDNVIQQDSLYQDVNTTPLMAKSGSQLNLVFRRGGAPANISDIHLLTDIDLCLGGITVVGRTNWVYSGIDILYGHVHANSDIWIRCTAGGTNNGWPIFHELVTLTGEIRVYPSGGSNYPADLIFRGGLVENIDPRSFENGASNVRQNGIWPFGAAHYDNRIAFVTIEGTNYTSYVGQINDTITEEFIVYDSYPPYGPIGDSVAVNYITRKDTVWTPGPSGSINNQSVFVPFELWISGNISGRQTWASAGNIYIKDDITYAGTVVGQPPDGGLDGDYPVNSTDYFGLISEKSIIIQYGYRDPSDSLRYKPNTDDINIYGSLVANGDGQGDPWQDGAFTFQYQHPKGSTPDQIWQDSLYTNIDLHRFRYPTSAFNPWPPGLDYPWYNPLWPEVGPTYNHPFIPNPHGAPQTSFLRGTINLYGSISQRRRGYVRRYGYNEHDTGEWDLENHLFGRHTNIPAGYNKNYHYDHRLSKHSPPDMPDVPFASLVQEELVYMTTTDGENFDLVMTRDIEMPDEPIKIAANGNNIAIFSDRTLLLFTEGVVDWDEYEIPLSYWEKVQEIVLTDDQLYFLTTQKDVTENSYGSKLYVFDLYSNDLILLDSIDSPDNMQTIFSYQGGIVHAASYDHNTIHFYWHDPYRNTRETFVWNHGITDIDDYCIDSSVIGVAVEGEEIVVAIQYRKSNDFSTGNYNNIYAARGNLGFQSTEDVYAVKPDLQLTHYPNPFSRKGSTRAQNLNISFTLQDPMNVEINIYNIKGQLVKRLAAEDFVVGSHQVSWNGRDNRNREVANGVYFYKVVAGGETLARKLLIIE